MVFLCALTTQKISKFSEIQLQKSPHSAFKLVHDAMKIAITKKAISKSPLTTPVVQPLTVKKKEKSVTVRKPSVISTSQKQLPNPSIPPVSVISDIYIPLVTPKNIYRLDAPLMHPKPQFTQNFNSKEQNFLHEFNTIAAPSLLEEDADETLTLVFEQYSPLKRLDDDISTLWSQKGYATRRVVGSVSSCTGAESPSIHLTESIPTQPINSLVNMVENLYKEISPDDNERDKEIAHNIIGILKIYTAYGENRSEITEPVLTEILKVDIENLCAKDPKNSGDIKTPQKLICAIEAQKLILENILSPYDLQVLNVTQKLLEEWLLEGGDNFYSKSKEIIQAIEGST